MSLIQLFSYLGFSLYGKKFSLLNDTLQELVKNFARNSIKRKKISLQYLMKRKSSVVCLNCEKELSRSNADRHEIEHGSHKLFERQVVNNFQIKFLMQKHPNFDCANTDEVVVSYE